MKNNIKNSTVIQYSSTGTEKIKMIDNLLTVFKNRNVPEENLNEVREELSSKLFLIAFLISFNFNTFRRKNPALNIWNISTT